jgi:hypothetical protein
MIWVIELKVNKRWVPMLTSFASRSSARSWIEEYKDNISACYDITDMKLRVAKYVREERNG